MDKMNFSEALHELKAGAKVARAGWNGRGMYLFLQPGYPEGIPANEQTAHAMGVLVGAQIKVRPYIAMVDAQGYVVSGWLASQTDILACDWETV